MQALSIRQPYVEMILRGIKPIEYRSRRTTRIAERFYLYASTMPGPADLFAELACAPNDLKTGYLLGTAKTSHCTKQRRKTRGMGMAPCGRKTPETSAQIHGEAPAELVQAILMTAGVSYSLRRSLESL